MWEVSRAGFRQIPVAARTMSVCTVKARLLTAVWSIVHEDGCLVGRRRLAENYSKRLARGRLASVVLLTPGSGLVTFTSQREPQFKCGDADHGVTSIQATFSSSPNPPLLDTAAPSLTTTASSAAPPTLLGEPRLRLLSLSARPPRASPVFTRHVSNTGKGTGEAGRVDVGSAPEHGGPAERQCCPRPRRRWWGAAVHGSDVCLLPAATVRRTPLTRHPHSYPLITLSTRAQVESKRAQLSTLNAARRIIKREGVAGLYAGMDSALFGITVTNFVYYYCTPSPDSL